MNDDVKAAVEKLREAFEFDRKRCGNDTAESLWRDELLILAHIDGEPARIASACEEVREACAESARRVGWSIAATPTANLDAVCLAVRATPLTATPLADALRLANETVVKLAQASTEAQARADEGVRYWTDLAQAEARDAAALRARVAELEADLREADETYCKDAERAEKAEAEAERDEKAVERAALETTLMAFKARFTEVLAERDALRAWVSAVSEALGAIEPVSDCRVELSANAAAALAESLRAQVEAARKVCELRIKTQWRVPDVYITAHDVLRAMDGAKP